MFYVFLIIKIFVISFMVTPFILGIILTGIEKCKNNNPFGILVLTIGLNIIGTIIGCMIIYKNQHPEFKFWKSFGNKIKFTFKIKRKKIKSPNQPIQISKDNV